MRLLMSSTFVAPFPSAKRLAGTRAQRRSRTSTCPCAHSINMCEPVITLSTNSVEFEEAIAEAKPKFLKPKKYLQPLPNPVIKESDPSQVCLPQKVPRNERILRKFQVSRSREQYQWTYNEITGAGLIASLPTSELPHRRWIVLMKRMENRCNENSTAIKGVSAHTSTESDEKRTDPFRHFKNQFATVELPKMAVNNEFLRDDIFAWYRIAGPNPMMIKRLECSVSYGFPNINDEVFRSIPQFENDSLQLALSENRLFEVDYSHLHDIQSVRDRSKSRKEDMFLYSPRALFAVPKHYSHESPLLPIAIRCDVKDNFVYSASRKHTSGSAWHAAKLTVQVADAFVHQTVFHFARTHLLLEAVLCASYRTLACTHPILKLLSCHFEGTAFINNSSLRALICPDGPIDHITAPDIEDTRKFAARNVVEEFNFTDAMPDTEFKLRGVDKKSAPLLRFPYRDDAIALWESILEWTQAYVDSFYTHDRDVKLDYELQSWGHEVTLNGRIKGFGTNGKLLTKEALSRAVSMVIFTASVQHAAVNFPQKEMMQFTPAMPLAGYSSLPGAQKSYETDRKIEDLEEFKKMLPGLSQAEEQLRAAELLGVVRYTQLGQYGKRLDFAGETVQQALQRFQMRLEDLEKKIITRNCEEDSARLVPYTFLKPSLIPQSTNV